MTAANLKAATVTTLAGGPNYYANDSSSYGSTNSDYGSLYSQFHTPMGLALDSSQQFLFVADRDNNAIRYLDLDGGFTYTLSTNSLNKPVGVAVNGSFANSAATIYVLDRGSTNSAGVATNGNVISFDSYGDTLATNALHLTNAAGIALDYSGNIYTTINSNQILKIIAPGASNVVATITNAGTLLQGLVVMSSGLIAVCDAGNNGVWLVNPALTNSYAPLIGFKGQGDNTGTSPGNDIYLGVNTNQALFFQPSGIAQEGNGILVVSDYGNNRVKVICVNAGGATIATNLYGVSSNYWGSASYPGWVDGGVVEKDQFNNVQSRLPYGLAVDSSGNVYSTEDYYHLIREVTSTGLPPPPPPPPAAPSAPTGLTATAGYGQISLSWIGSVGATSNDVERSTSSGGPYAVIGYSLTNSFVDTNVLDGTNYYYVVSAVNAGGGSPVSGQASAAPLFSPPPVFQSVVSNYNQISLTWSVSAGAVSYNVERSQTSGTNYQTIANTAATSYSDNTVVNGTTYYYVIAAVNAGGANPTNSAQVSATPPLPPVPNPQIGWVTYPPPSPFYSVFNAGTPAGNTFNNDVDLVISNSSGVQTYFTFANTTVVTNVSDPSPSSTTAPSGYVDGLAKTNVEQNYTINSLIQPEPNLMVKAISEQAGHPNSDIVAALFQFVAGTPGVIGTNAAQFVLTNITVGADMYYTTDGSYPGPANAAAVGPVTNGATLSLSFPAGTTNLTFEAVGYRANYSPSAVYTNNFAASNFVANLLTFGFTSGQASSRFIASPGQTFYAPITLTILSGTLMDQLQFNLTVTNAGPNPGPAITPGAFNFTSMLMQPLQGFPGIYTPIPPYMFDNTNSSIITNNVLYHGTTNFVDMNFTNTSENFMAVGWEERQGMTNLYPTTTQDLIQYSIAHDTLYLQSGGQVIVGGYSFHVPVTAVSGQTYQIQIGAPSATTDGIGDPGSAVFIQTPVNGSLTNGAMNSIKDVTMGQLRYIVGDVYPFNWFNAGDFGQTNLTAPDVAQVFEAAIYSLNVPPYDPTSVNSIGGYTNVSDLYDAMDSCGATYVDLGHGYLEKDSTVTGQGAVNALFGGNDQTINQIAFGDGVLDVCDVYVTYRRSLDPTLVWFQRFWTNGVRVAVITSNTISSSGVQVQSADTGTVIAADDSTPISTTNAPISVTNTPVANFTTTDYLATAGQTLSIPINVAVFGQYNLRVAMIDVSVQPLDGSPALTTPVSFITSGTLGSPYIATNSVNTYGAAWLNSSITGISGSGNIGTLLVTIPTNATSMSAYAIHFDHASGSPNGIASFSRHTLTGLITLSSRTNSYYDDGIPDSWRLRYFGTIYNYLSVSNADADGTGMENWQKYQAGLNPTDPTSVLTVGTDQAMAQSQQDSVVAWPTINGKTYVIQRSATLFPPNWIPVSTNIGNGTYMEIHDSPTNWYKFYRVQAQ